MSTDQPNPYESSSQSGETPFGSHVPIKKPASITVFGILNLVFGVMGIFGLLGAAAVFWLLPRDPNIPNPTLQIMDQGGPYAVFTYASMILGLPVTIALIVAGFGLLMSKPFGRTLSVWYAIYAIVMGIIGPIFQYVYLLRPMMENMQGNSPQQAAAIGGAIGGMVGGLIGLIYPVLLLYFMTRPHVVSYLQQAKASGQRGQRPA